MHDTPKIVKGRALPPRVDRIQRFPWRDMEIGDSFDNPGASKETTIRSAAHQAGKRLGRKFVVRQTPEGLRVWRIA